MYGRCVIKNKVSNGAKKFAKWEYLYSKPPSQKLKQRGNIVLCGIRKVNLYMPKRN